MKCRHCDSEPPANGGPCCPDCEFLKFYCSLCHDESDDLDGLLLHRRIVHGDGPARLNVPKQQHLGIRPAR